DDVGERAERKPRRSYQQAEREKRDDKSLFPLLSGAAQETGEHGQQCDSRVSYPTSGGDILFIARLRSLHGIASGKANCSMGTASFVTGCLHRRTLYGCADNNGQSGGTMRRIALGTA